MSELKKCPFCGGEAILESDIIGKGKELWYVSCKSDCVTQYGYCTTKERAIEKWNTRKPVERIVERLEKEYDINNWGKPYGISLDKVIEIIKEEVGQIEEAHN